MTDHKDVIARTRQAVETDDTHYGYISTFNMPKDDATALCDALEALTAAPAHPATDTRKLCTCDGAGRGPGRECAVKSGVRLGELWRCARGLEAAPAQPEPVKRIEGDPNPPALTQSYSQIGAANGATCGPDSVLAIAPAQPEPVNARLLEALETARAYIESHLSTGREADRQRRFDALELIDTTVAEARGKAGV